MSYPIDLDDMEDERLTTELARRRAMRRWGLCDYCALPPSHASCKHGDRRHKLALADAVDQAALAARVAYLRGLADGDRRRAFDAGLAAERRHKKASQGAL